MPNRDKSGPFGNGPRTGRGFGNCKNQKQEDNMAKKPVVTDITSYGRLPNGDKRMSGRFRNKAEQSKD